MVRPQGPAAETIDGLWWLLLALGTSVFVLVVVLLVLAVLRSGDPRPDTGGPDTGGPDTGGPDLGGPDTGSADDPASVADARPRAGAVRWLLIGGGVVLPAVLVIVVLVATVAAMRAVPGEAEATMTIEVTGHRWFWEIHYPDNGVAVANEIHIPTGQPVLLQLRSADVVHSLWVPELAGKMDLLPEATTTLVIEADHPGRYGGRCAEFCGLGHTGMAVTVVAHEPAELEDWLAAQRRSTPTPIPTPPGGPGGS
jgi:cytochrome c oxidase subunit 2